MAKCPSCGADNPSSVKSWSMISKPSKSGEMQKLMIGLYKCCSCGKSFRYVEGKEKITMRGVLDRSNSLEEKLMEATKKRAELEERVQALENEKACLNAEIEALKVIPILEEKASSLESTVSRLRDEKETLLKKVNELLAEKMHAPKEKPLEAYITEQAPEIQSSVTETHVAEPGLAAPAAEAIPEETVEVALAEAPCEAAPVEVPSSEKLSELIHEEPKVTEAKPYEMPQLEPVSVVGPTAEITVHEPELKTVDELTSEKIVPAEPIAAEAQIEAHVVEEKPTEAPQTDIMTNTVNVIQTPTTEMPEETPTIETAIIEEKTSETPQIVSAPPEVTPVETALPDVKIDVVKVMEPLPSETQNTIPPTGPKAEMNSVIETSVETPSIEATQTETLQITKTEEPLDATTEPIATPAELPTEDIPSPTPLLTEEDIVKQIDTEVTQMTEPNQVQEKLAEIIQQSITTPALEQPTEVPIAEVTQVMVTNTDTPIPEPMKAKTLAQVENITDTQTNEEKPA